MKKLFVSFMGLVFMTSLGCNKANITPDPSLYDKGKKVVLMWEAPSPHAEELIIEKGGLLGVLSNEALQQISHGYRVALEETKLAPIVDTHYFSPYSTPLEENGMSVFLVKLPIDPKRIREKKQKKAPRSIYDFSYLKAEKDIDYVLFLDINHFGIRTHTFYGVPLKKSVAKSVFTLYLVDTSDNQIVGRYHFSDTGKKVSKDEDGSYEQYKEDIKALLIQGLSDAYFGFFEE